MKKISFLILVNYCLFLTACVNQISSSSTFQIPHKIRFEGKEYVQASHNQLDEMQHLLYLPHNEKVTPEHWQQGILIFLDKNSQHKTLAQRLALREKIFKQQPKTIAKLQVVNDELRSEILYPPTQREQNIQFDVSRGRNLNCGFAEIQYATKRSYFAKNLQNLTAYKNDIAKLMQKFNQLAWQIACQ